MTFFWLMVIIICSIIEALTINLVTIWFVASGIIALITSLFNIPVIYQTSTFIILGIITLITTRKPLEKMLNKTKQKTNLDRILEMKGIVTEEIDKHKNGEVKVDGKKWTAVANQKITQGSYVKIIKIDGVKLIVEEV